MTHQFISDVHAGLSKSSKTLPSKYFYDSTGDALFVKIMALPEYYLTRAEMEIFATQTKDLIDSFGFTKTQHFELIEFGAGDGSKTIELLRALVTAGYDFEYLPIDISQNALDGLATTLKAQLPSLVFTTRQGDYLDVLDELKDDTHPKVVLFLGSNIGNLGDAEAASFIYDIGSDLSPGDKLLLGVDRIKSADVVLPAYNDRQGITREFNLNLLRRINHELDGNFNLDQFEHVAEYDEADGIARSFLLSKSEQTVEIGRNAEQYHFRAGEKIQTEISRKYSDDVLRNILTDTDFEISQKFSDHRHYFSDYLLERV